MISPFKIRAFGERIKSIVPPEKEGDDMLMPPAQAKLD